jgi:hypothetical protein
MPANTGTVQNMTDKPKSTRFQPGQSGNPAGKPAGTRNKATRLILSLMEDNAKEITQAVIDAAKGGDLGAAKIVIERIAPPLRERPVSLDLPDTSTAKGCASAQNAILQAIAAGDLLPGEAQTISGIVESHRRAIETIELEQRIAALEAKK